MALTLPGCWEVFDSKFLALCFKKLGERFARQAQKAKGWEIVGASWKKEIQRRGALHWHLLFYGLEDHPALAEQVRHWFALQWNTLICADLPEEERRKHFVWHDHPKNWEPVRSVAYFAKYVGKVVDRSDLDESTGRWWGFWNRAAVPWADEESGVLAEAIAVDVHRALRKIRQKRMNHAKQTALAKKLKTNCSPFSPTISNPAPVTLWDLQRLKQGYGPHGRSRDHSALWLAVLEIMQKQAGIRLGKYRIKRNRDAEHVSSRTPSICLTGGHVPAMVLRLIEWSSTRHGIPMPALVSKKAALQAAEQKRELRSS